MDVSEYVTAAARLESEAEQHIATAEKCRVAAAALRELAGELPERRAPKARPPAARTAPPQRPAAKAPAREKERKVRNILCSCGCGEFFEWDSKRGRAPRYIPEHKLTGGVKRTEPKPDGTTAKEKKLRKILCACGCGKTFETSNPETTRLNGHWSKRPKSAPSPEPTAPPPRTNGPAPSTPPVEPIRANRIEEARARSRFRCPKHGAECRTPNLCKTTYTRPS